MLTPRVLDALGQRLRSLSSYLSCLWPPTRRALTCPSSPPDTVRVYARASTCTATVNKQAATSTALSYVFRPSSSRLLSSDVLAAYPTLICIAPVVGREQSGSEFWPGRGAKLALLPECRALDGQIDGGETQNSCLQRCSEVSVDWWVRIHLEQTSESTDRLIVDGVLRCVRWWWKISEFHTFFIMKILVRTLTKRSSTQLRRSCSTNTEILTDVVAAMRFSAFAVEEVIHRITAPQLSWNNVDQSTSFSRVSNCATSSDSCCQQQMFWFSLYCLQLLVQPIKTD